VTEETQKSPNTQEMEETKEEKDEATKLAIFLTIITKSQKKTIQVKAITDKGQVDTSRDDEIEFSINPESLLRFIDKSKKLRLKLVNGEVDATVKSGLVPESVVFYAKWISGKSPLKNVQVSYLVSSHV
jgi:hypothetical protein